MKERSKVSWAQLVACWSVCNMPKMISSNVMNMCDYKNDCINNFTKRHWYEPNKQFLRLRLSCKLDVKLILSLWHLLTHPPGHSQLFSSYGWGYQEQTLH